MPATAWIAHTALALLAWRTLGLYTDGPPAMHDYFWDGASLALASLTAAMQAMHWYTLGLRTLATEPYAQPSPVADTVAQLKAAMFSGFWLLGPWFPQRKIASILAARDPRRAKTYATHFSLYQAILRIDHFLLAHGLAALVTGYALSAGEAFTRYEPLASLGPLWLLLCWCIWIYCSSWLLLAACMVLRTPPAQG